MNTQIIGDSYEFEHDVAVKGWLDAPNIKHPLKGLFVDSTSLKQSYPRPMAGWMALVGDTLPAQLWMVEKGEWAYSGKMCGDLLNVWISDTEVKERFDTLIEDLIKRLEETLKENGQLTVDDVRKELEGYMTLSDARSEFASKGDVANLVSQSDLASLREEIARIYCTKEECAQSTVGGDSRVRIYHYAKTGLNVETTNVSGEQGKISIMVPEVYVQWEQTDSSGSSAETTGFVYSVLMHVELEGPNGSSQIVEETILDNQTASSEFLNPADPTLVIDELDSGQWMVKYSYELRPLTVPRYPGEVLDVYQSTGDVSEKYVTKTAQKETTVQVRQAVVRSVENAESELE